MAQCVRTFFAPHLSIMRLDGTPLPISIESIISEVGSPIMQLKAQINTPNGPIYGVVLRYDAAAHVLDPPADPDARSIVREANGYGPTREDRLSETLRPYTVFGPVDPRAGARTPFSLMLGRTRARTGIRVRSYFSPRLPVDGHPVFIERIMRDMGSPIMLLTVSVVTSAGTVDTGVRYDSGKRITIDLPEDKEAKLIMLDARGPGAPLDAPNPLADAIEPYIRD